LTPWYIILNSCSTSQAIPHHFWNPKLIHPFQRDHHHSLSWTRWIKSKSWHQLSIRSILPPVSRSQGICHCRIPNWNFVCILHFYHYLFLYLITLIPFDKRYKLRSRFTQPPKHMIMKQYLLPLHSVTSNICSPRAIRWIILSIFLTNHNL
jgi:hypothetical protein